MSFPGCVDAFLPTQIHIKSSSWRHHIWREKLESSELLLLNGNLATLDNLGFPSIKSHEHEQLQVTLEPISGFCSYRWSKNRNVFSLPPTVAVWKVRIVSSSFPGPSPDDGLAIGQLDFEGNVDGVGQHKRTLKKGSGFFSKGARYLQTWRQGIWLCGSVSESYKWWNLIILSPSSPPNKATAWGKEGPPFLLPTQVLHGWGRVCVSVAFLY